MDLRPWCSTFPPPARCTATASTFPSPSFKKESESSMKYSNRTGNSSEEENHEEDVDCFNRVTVRRGAGFLRGTDEGRTRAGHHRFAGYTQAVSGFRGRVVGSPVEFQARAGRLVGGRGSGAHRRFRRHATRVGYRPAHAVARTA